MISKNPAILCRFEWILLGLRYEYISIIFILTVEFCARKY